MIHFLRMHFIFLVNDWTTTIREHRKRRSRNLRELHDYFQALAEYDRTHV